MDIGQYTSTTVQVITTNQIIGIGSTSAIAGSLFTLLGIYLKSWFESKENKKNRLFEARKNAYSGLIGHLNNTFAKYNFKIDNNNPEILLKKISDYSINIDYEFADALLFSSKNLKEKIEKYKTKVFNNKGQILSDWNKKELEQT